MTLQPLPRHTPLLPTLASAIGVALLASIAGLALALSILGTAGAGVHAVLSDSMAPAFQRGDLVVTKPAAQLQVGDTVTFHKYGSLVTHRIVALGREAGTFETRGDANPGNDPWTITAADVTGSVRGVVARAGFPLLLLENALGRVLAVNLVLSLIVLLWWALPRATRVSPRLLHPSAGYAIA